MPRILRDLIVIAALVAAGWYAWDSHLGERFLGGPVRHEQVILYTVDDCADCRARARELEADGVLYTEIRVDLDEYMLQRMHARLQESGYRSRIVEFPVVDVHGRMLPNNPPIQRIRAQLR